MTSMLRYVLLFNLLLLLAIPAHSQDTVSGIDLNAIDLQPQFAEGRTTRYEFWTLWSQNTDSPAGSATIQYELNGEITWTVDKVRADGSATCTKVINWIAMELTDPEGNVMKMDSRKSKGDYEMTQKRLQAMAGSPITCEMSATGEVLSVKGLKALNRKLPEGASEFDEIDFIESASSMATLPGAPESLAIGKSWKMNYSWTHDLTGLEGILDHDMRYKLETVEQLAGIPVATVSESSKIRYTPDLSEIPADGPDIKVKMTSGSLDSQVMFDLQRHEAVGRNTVENRNFKISISFRGQSVTTTISETVQGQLLRIAEQ